VLWVGGSGLDGPGEGEDDREAGSDASESALVVDSFAGNPGPEEDPSDLGGKDRVDLTGVWAVAGVVSFGNVLQLTDESATESEVTEEAGEGEAPVPGSGGVGGGGVTEESPVDELPGDAAEKTEAGGLSGVSVNSGEVSTEESTKDASGEGDKSENQERS